MGGMTDDTSPENLRKFLDSDDPAMVGMGLSMAKGMGVPEELLPTILGLYMWDDDKTVRAAAKSVFNKHAPAEIQATVKENWKPSTRTAPFSGDKLPKAVRAFVQAFKSQDDFSEIGLMPLIKALESEVWYNRTDSARALGKIGDKRAVEPLIKVLEDTGMVFTSSGANVETTRGWVLQTAATALGEIGDERAVEPLIRMLSDDRIFDIALSDDDICLDNCTYVIGALWEIPDARAVEPLIKTLSCDKEWICSSAMEVLGKIGDKRAVEPLIEVLSDEDSGVRRDAVEALGKIGDGRAMEPLIKVLNDENEWLHEAAKKALKQLGHEVE